GTLADVSVAVQGGTFTKIVFNPNGSGTPNIGPATLTVNTDGLSNGTTYTGSDFTLSNGSNFYTLEATGGEKITSIHISVSTAGRKTGFNDLRQVRIGGHGPDVTSAAAAPAPPGVLLGLVGAGSLSGFAGLNWLRRRLGRA